jgi:hypothetical protein
LALEITDAITDQITIEKSKKSIGDFVGISNLLQKNLNQVYFFYSALMFLRPKNI